jgi:hypothetical protein
MEAMVKMYGIERVVVLDQGSRPGTIVGNLPQGGGALLLIDHHQSEEVRRSRPTSQYNHD